MSEPKSFGIAFVVNRVVLMGNCQAARSEITYISSFWGGFISLHFLRCVLGCSDAHMLLTKMKFSSADGEQLRWALTKYMPVVSTHDSRWDLPNDMEFSQIWNYRIFAGTECGFSYTTKDRKVSIASVRNRVGLML